MSPVVDVHSHIYPDWYLDYFRGLTQGPRVVEASGVTRMLLFTTEAGVSSGPVVTDDYTSIAKKLAFMDRHGIDVSVVSLGNPWLDDFDGEASLRMSREANTRLAAFRSETEGRVIGMGVLPSGEPSDIAVVIEEVAHTPGLRGVIARTEIGGLLLDDDHLEVVWRALEAHRVPLMIHPMLSSVPPDLEGYGIALTAGLGFAFSTTVALARLLLGGVLDRYPALRVVAAHGGGALPFLMSRLEATSHRSDHGLRDAAGRLLLDATLYDASAVRLAAELVGADRLLLGTDHPFPNADFPRVSQAVKSALSETDASQVLGAAAARWYRL